MIPCEFVYPADSNEVIYQAEMNSVPRVCDLVRIKNRKYRVYNIEWVDHHPLGYKNKMSAVINLIEDEIK